MAQGQDRIAQSLLDLEPTAIIELFLLYFNTTDKPNSFIAFHGGSSFAKGVVWQGIEYLPIPTETDGFEVNANGQLSRPRIRVSNKDYFVTDLLLNNEDLQFAKFIRKRTFVKYLDDINFDGGNPWGQADASAEISADTYVIGQKTAENKVFVELELTSPLDLENFEINNRLIMSRYCSWYYRGNGCNYRGIPLATEDGRKLQIKDPLRWDVLGEWQTGRFYLSGEAAYIENTKIIVSNPQEPSDTGFAQIWYVCQNDHDSSFDKKPDTNENFWLRDGCNKKLDGCRLRFGKGAIRFNERIVERTINYVDFQSRAGSKRYNNITLDASISGSTQNISHPATNVGDLKTGSADEWHSTTNNPSITLSWDSPKQISRIDLYDRTSTSNDFRNARITCFDADDTLISSGLLTGIPTNGSRITTGFSPILSAVRRIQVSGSGTAGGNIGLGELVVFENSSPFLSYIDDSPAPIHQQESFQLSTWIQLSGREIYPNEVYSVFHNIGGINNSRYSGVNCYLSGQQINLDFATRRTGQGSSVMSTPKTISLPWPNDELRPIHLICSGGYASGESPSEASDGYIRITNGTDSANYVLNNNSGEYFQFKNPLYQSGIVSTSDRLKFGINDWQFPPSGANSAAFPPDPAINVTNSLKRISPCKFGPTAIWTGLLGLNNRLREYEIVPKNYQDVTGFPYITNDLVGWWDMEPDSTGLIEAENDSSKSLVIFGDEADQYQSSEIKQTTLTDFVNLPKQSSTLPFGGFPGTEKYG